MYVCICNRVTEADIRREADHGVRSFAQLQQHTGCSTCCGCCEVDARRTLNEAVGTVQCSIPLTVAA